MPRSKELQYHLDLIYDITLEIQSSVKCFTEDEEELSKYINPSDLCSWIDRLRVLATTIPQPPCDHKRETFHTTTNYEICSDCGTKIE